MENVLKLKFVKLALAIVVASALAQLSKATSINDCVFLFTCYSVSITLPGGNMISDAEPSPLSQSLSGLDPNGFGNASGFAMAGFGSVGAKAQATDTDAGGIGSGLGAEASASYGDVFEWNGPPAQLRFSVSLQCSSIVSGAAPNKADVHLALDLGATQGGAGSVDLFGPGSGAATINVGTMDQFSLGLTLLTDVVLQNFGNGVSDFANTAEITRIELLDTSGNFVRDVALTDRSGNVLGAPEGTVPEPGTLVLAGAGLIAVRILAAAGRRAFRRLSHVRGSHQTTVSTSSPLLN